MDYEQIQVSQRERVVTLTLNRPDRMNAWTYQMSGELVHAIEQCNEDPEVGAMIITGSGRGFCAGADIEDVFAVRAEQDEQGEREAQQRGGTADWVGLLRRSKPILAAVNGASVGIGATMILPCDIILASTQAKFALGFIKMGLVPELASSHFLVQRLGFGRASEMCLSGRLFSGDQASDLGLVDHLCAPDELLETAHQLAQEIAANPGPQLRWIKQLLTANGAETDLSTVQRRELEALQQAYATPEHKEAIAAFMEKRPADFRAAAAAHLTAGTKEA